MVPELPAAMLQVQNQVQNGLQDAEPGENAPRRGLLQGLHEKRGGKQVHTYLFDKLPSRHLRGSRDLPM